MDEQPFPARLRSTATAVAVMLTLALSAVASCDSRQDPPLTVQQKLERSHIWGRPKLRIGVARDQPLMSEEHADGYRGFDVEIARFLAGRLGYTDSRIDFVPVDTGDRIPALQASRVDMVVASLSITRERKEQINLAGPYFVTRQKVMVRKAMVGKITTIEDLRNPAYRVCVSGGSTTEAELTRRGVDPKIVENVGECADGLLKGKYDAFSSDDTILTGFYSQHADQFQIVKLPFGQAENLGVGVSINDPDLRDLIAYFLNESYQDGLRNGSSAWLTAYNNNLGPWMLPDPASPLPQQPEPNDVPELVDHDDKTSRQGSR